MLLGQVGQLETGSRRTDIGFSSGSHVWSRMESMQILVGQHAHIEGCFISWISLVFRVVRLISVRLATSMSSAHLAHQQMLLIPGTINGLSRHVYVVL